MKKCFLLLLCLLALAGCSNDNGTMEIEEGDEPPMLTGGWIANPELPTINDAVFEKATAGSVGPVLSPVIYLGSQVVAGTNHAYLAYGNASTLNFKVVIVYQDLEGKCTITHSNEFDIDAMASAENSGSTEQLAGGWTHNTELNNMLSEEMNAVFESAVEGLSGVGYQPVCLLGSQVVAGTNYLFLAKGTTVTAEPVTGLYLVNVYSALDGSASISNISRLNIGEFNR